MLLADFNNLAQGYLLVKKKAKAKMAFRGSKLPTFDVPPCTLMISGYLAEKIWQEEGLDDMEAAIRLGGE